MLSPLPDIDLVDAVITATHYTPARRHVPGFWRAWLTLADGSAIQLLGAEVRGLQDLGFVQGPITGIEERASTPFATGLAPGAVCEKSRPSRIFALQGVLNYRFIAAQKGELVASELRQVPEPEAAPAASLPLAAPIPWEQAVTMLQQMRLLDVVTLPGDEGMQIRIAVGAPRGTYVLLGTGGQQVVDGGYPGDSGIGTAQLEPTEDDALQLTLEAGGKGAGRPALRAIATQWRVHKVQPASA